MGQEGEDVFVSLQSERDWEGGLDWLSNSLLNQKILLLWKKESLLNGLKKKILRLRSPVFAAITGLLALLYFCL